MGTIQKWETLRVGEQPDTVYGSKATSLAAASMEISGTGAPEESDGLPVAREEEAY